MDKLYFKEIMMIMLILLTVCTLPAYAGTTADEGDTVQVHYAVSSLTVRPLRRISMILL